MAYPFSEMPCFKDFRETLKRDYGCSFFEIEEDFVSISYFERTCDGEKLQCPVSFNGSDNDILTPTVLRYVCRRLKINPKPFGLHLG